MRAVHLDTIDSTNAEALRRARAGERGPLWIVARLQSAGRGRRGRSWESNAGNLHATLLLTDPAPALSAPQLGFVAGLAVHDAANASAPALDFALKWPNDLLCRRRKIGGILIEGEATPMTAAIGIGINCCSHPQATDYPATDFAAEGSVVTAEALFARLSASMTTRLQQWDRGAGFAVVRSHWLARADGLGHPIRVRLAEREIAGVFADIDADGQLLLRHAEGGPERLGAITAGDVFLL